MRSASFSSPGPPRVALGGDEPGELRELLSGPTEGRVESVVCLADETGELLELPDHVVALQLGHTDGGTLVRELYGHPDAAIARERTRAAFRRTAPVAALAPASLAAAS